MRNCFIIITCCVITAVCVFSNIKAQVLGGRVTDRGLNSLKGVSIHLLNTPRTTFSDKDGNFYFNKLAIGSYVIELSAVGYATIVRPVNVTAGKNEVINFQLQTAAVQLEALTVTAEKKEELLQNVPVSVTALSATQVQEFRLWNTKDLTAIVPNLYSGTPGDERNVTSIRGITTTSYDPAVATYVDGVNQFNLDTYIPQLFDVERIEILRGPQGTLYGRNAMGGVINIITKQPTNNINGFVELNFGNYNQQRYSMGLRTPIVKDKLFIGASGVFNKRDGYYINEFNNTSFDNQGQVTGNYYLKYLPGAKWTVTLNIKHQNNRSDGAFPVVNGVDEALNSPFLLNQNALGRMIDNTLNTSLSVNHAGSKVSFASQLAWQNNHRFYNAPIDGDFSPLDAVVVINDYGDKWNNVKVLTHELRLNSSATDAAAFSWTAGTYFFHQNNPVKQGTHFGKDAALLGVPDSNFSTINISTGKNTGAAVYGQVNYSLTKKLRLIAGLRYDYEDKELTVRGEYQPDGQDPFVITPDTAASAHFSALSPKFGFQYQFTPNNTLYANYSRGFRTGGLTQLSSDPSQPPLFPYKPEYSNSMEAGIKNDLLDNKLRINAGLFLTYINDAQVPTLILPDAITVTRNTGKLTSKGAEVELLYKPVKGLMLQYAGGYTHADYKSLKVSSNGQAVDLNGKSQIYTPDVTSMLTLQYGYLLSDRHQIRLVARGEWYYLGRRYFDVANNIRQSPYNLLNSRVGVSFKHAEIFLWARNITNRKYIEYAYDFGAVHLGNPATYGVTLRSML